MNNKNILRWMQTKKPVRIIQVELYEVSWISDFVI
jgi:hypothetical protein